MTDILLSLNWPAVLTATLVYLGLGALWFAPPVFGRRWENAIAFTRPAGWRPGVRSYLGPLVGCFAASIATALLARAIDAHSTTEGLILGGVVGLGYGAAIAGTDAMSPRHDRPIVVAAIVGAYHAVGLAIVALIVTMWR